jgi:hypothetical protein
MPFLNVRQSAPRVDLFGTCDLCEREGGLALQGFGGELGVCSRTCDGPVVPPPPPPPPGAPDAWADAK